MDKTVAKLALLSLVLTLAFVGVVKCVDTSSNDVVETSVEIVENVLPIIPDVQVPTLDVTVDAGSDASPDASSVPGTVDAGKVVKRYTHSRKLVWMCTEPRETGLGTFVRDCKDVEVK